MEFGVSKYTIHGNKSLSKMPKKHFEEQEDRRGNSMSLFQKPHFRTSTLGMILS